MGKKVKSNKKHYTPIEGELVEVHSYLPQLKISKHHFPLVGTVLLVKDDFTTIRTLLGIVVDVPSREVKKAAPIHGEMTVTQAQARWENSPQGAALFTDLPPEIVNRLKSAYCQGFEHGRTRK